MIKRYCKECGKEFFTYPSKIRQGRGVYCSRECSNKNTLIKTGQLGKGMVLSVKYAEFQKLNVIGGYRYIT